MNSVGLNVLCVLFLLLSLAKQTHTSKSCELTINNCNYTVSVLHSKNCQNYNYGFRKRRSTVAAEETDAAVEILASRFKKLQHRLTKEMKLLSKRVLRGVRKMETMISDLATKQTKRGLTPRKTCPPGFMTLDNWNSCYMFSTFNTTWYEARDFCGALDSDMVSLGTLKEHYFVTFMIKNNLEYHNASGWWTSGTFVAKTKQWMWTSDVEMRPFTFIKWAVKEPNELSLQCVMLYKDADHLWHDTVCTDKFNFICEISM